MLDGTPVCHTKYQWDDEIKRNWRSNISYCELETTERCNVQQDSSKPAGEPQINRIFWRSITQTGSVLYIHMLISVYTVTCICYTTCLIIRRFETTWWPLQKAKGTNDLPVRSWTLVKTKCIKNVSKKGQTCICGCCLASCVTLDTTNQKNKTNHFFQFLQRDKLTQKKLADNQFLLTIWESMRTKEFKWLIRNIIISSQVVSK